MKLRARVSRGGQVSIPAAVRKRWKTDRVLIEDQGGALLVTPLPPDPLEAAIGSLRLPPGVSSESLRQQARREGHAAEVRRTRKG